MEEYSDTSCNNCGHIFTMGDTIYPLTLSIYRWNVCKECKDAVKKAIETLFTRCIVERVVLVS